ncbi:histone H4-like TAF Taf6, SAGA complex subunit [Taxawa tesnikishii (nom. ined.)]|nr:histone H4-like TAF Taf6, SAGA complex subunit [Dothideales sp. JES 119]
MSVWNPDNITDVAESVGIGTLNKDVVEHLARDVEYRISQVLEEALKFMRHGKRTTLSTQDISQALRLLDVEPLYGYESTRPLRFGEASIGPGQPLFYVEDEEVDFEKLINAPLPKVPREMSFTAHWLAVEGVQPSIPQNPTSADQRHQELLPKGPGANPNLAAVSGNDNISVKPLVKHVLSKELQLYFERICSAILDESNDEYRAAAYASLRTDPGLHQLVPYFIQFVADKVTHNLKSLFILTQMLQLLAALLENPSLYIAPYVASIVPSVLTCLIGKHLGSPNTDGPTAHFASRDYAASLLTSIARKHGQSSSTLKPRIARSCLKHFLDSHKSFGTHYGAILGLQGIAGSPGIRTLVLPNLKAYDLVLKQGMTDDQRRDQAEMVAGALLRVLENLEKDTVETMNGHSEGEELKERLVEAVGEVMGRKIFEVGRPGLISVALDKDIAV